MREVSFLILGALLASVFFFATDTDTVVSPSQLAAVQATASSSLPEDSKKSEAENTYRVLKVIDGDTLAIEMDGKSVTIRLIGLDTPETSDPRKPVQCFGKEASDKAKELLNGAYVSIEKDASQGDLDKYARLLAYVYLPDGTFFNEYMIAEGYGHEYTYGVPYKYQTQFRTAETHARENKKGLWSDTACAEESSRSTSKSTAPTPQILNGAYDCSKNTYNCTSFKTQAEAQSAFDSCGGNANDIHKLDSDKDGNVCESLP